MSRRLRTGAAVIAACFALGACGNGIPTKVAGPEIAFPSPDEIPLLGEAEFGSGGGTTTLGEEQLAEVAEATPPGLRITTLQIAPLSEVARDALNLTGFKNGRGPGLISLPVYGVNPQLGMYYLVVPVVNEGTEPVRNLKARADFIDANGIIVWTETLAVTHLPTRLGLNPPSLPNDPAVPPGELGLKTHGFGIYYFQGNVGLFTFAVPDTAVAATIKTWKLTFLVSTT
ncbi:MAG: hypothetical protein ACRDJ1_11875 [Actinomycetota bacterium]